MTASVVESLFSSVICEVFAFYNSAENSVTCIGIFREVALLEILRKFLFTGISGCQSTGTLLKRTAAQIS